MGYNARLNPLSISSNAFASVATNSSSIKPVFKPEQAGQILGAIFWNGSTATVASGTTAGSSLNVYVYKTASDTAASAVGSLRCAAIATLATAALTLSTSTALTRFTGTDVYLAELIGGVGNNNSTLGATVVLRYMYAHATTDDATP